MLLNNRGMLFFAAPSLSNVTDEQYFLQQDSVQEPSGNPTNPGGETTHARKEITPGKARHFIFIATSNVTTRS